MQKKVGNALYVFDTTPFTITEDTNVEVIYVQNECLKGYLELNTELESKIKTFNQWLLCVNAPWSDGASQEPTKNYHLLTVSGGNTQDLWVQNYDESMPPGNNNESYFDSYVNWQQEAGMIGPEEYNKIYCNAGAIIYIDGYGINEFETISKDLEQMTIPNRGEHYGVIMGDTDMTVDFSYTLKPTYHVNFSTDSNASADIEIDPQDQFAGENVYIRFLNEQSSSTITVTSADVELIYDQPNDEYSFTMPAHDVTIKAVRATEQPAQNYHLLTIPDFNEVQSIYVQGYDTNLLPGSSDYEWFYNFNLRQIDAGMLDGSAHNKIYCNPGAKIFIDEDIDNFETITGLEIIDTQRGQRYGVIMGDTDMTVDFSYTLKPTYHVSFSTDSNVHDGSVEISNHEQYAGKNVYIIFNGGASPSTITVTSNDVELIYDEHNNKYSFIMPARDVTIKAVRATEQPQNYHLLTIPGYDEYNKNLYTNGYDTNIVPGVTSTDWFHVINEAQRNAGMIDVDVTDKIYCNAGAKLFVINDINDFETIAGLEIIDTDRGQRYGVIMGDSDMTVDFSYTLKPTYHVNFSTDSNASADIEIDPQDQFAGENVYIRFLNEQNSSTITVTSGDVELIYDQPNDEYSFTMPARDVTIKAVHATEQPAQNYHLLTIPGYNSSSLYVYGYDNNTLPGGASNLWFHNVNENQRNAGMIDANVTDKIYCNAGAEIFLMAETGIYETMSGFSLIDTTGFGQRYGVIMGDTDMTVDFSYTYKPKYNINFSEDSTANGDLLIVSNPQYVGQTTYIRFKNGQSSSTITITSADVELTYDDSNKWYSFIMPDHDITIKAVYKPIQISLDLGNTDLTSSFDPSGTYYPNALFVAQVPEGKTVDNYTFVKSDDKIEVNPVTDHFDIKFKVSGTVTFANA